MRTRTVEVREGELLGPVDWSYDFRQHFNSYSSSEYADERCAKCVEFLKKIESEPDAWRAQFSHSDIYRDIYAIGMYDGWPYWKPTPALRVVGTLGPEWHFFYDLIGIKRNA